LPDQAPRRQQQPKKMKMMTTMMTMMTTPQQRLSLAFRQRRQAQATESVCVRRLCLVASRNAQARTGLFNAEV
jgi:hypothetical protein